MIPSVSISADKPEETYLPVRPYGLALRVKTSKVEVPEILKNLKGVTVMEPQEYRYEGVIEGTTACGVWRESPVSFNLPIVDSDGFFKVGHTLYYICEVGLPNPWKPLKFHEYSFLDRGQVIIRMLEHIFGTGFSGNGDGRMVSRSSPFATFFFNSTNRHAVHVNSIRLQTMLLSRLIAHPWVRQVQDTEIQKAGWKGTVILYPRQDGLKVDPYIYPESFRKRLDPTSTSVSNTVNRVYHLAEGARIKDGRIEPGVSDFCAFTRRNSVAITMSPKRAYLLRAAAMNSAKLAFYEDRPIDHSESLVDTVNLTTAIMDMGVNTFEDMIALSQSAADKLQALDTTRIVRWSQEPITSFAVEVGQKVKPFQTLAKDVVAVAVEGDLDGHDLMVPEDDTWRTATIVASELTEDAVLKDIQVTPQWYAGQLGYRTAFVLESEIPLRTGDKITNFAGCKGIVRVLPDSLMPQLPDGRHVNVCVSPLSVAKRACVSMLFEMAIGKSYERGERDQVEAFGDQPPESFSWVAVNWPHKEFLKIDGQNLPERTFWGVMPWMRILKSGIGYRRASAVGSERPLTSEGLLPDDASAAGQRMDSSKAIVMASRGLRASLKAILAGSPGSKALKAVVTALERPAGNDPFKAKKPEKAPEEIITG